MPGAFDKRVGRRDFLKAGAADGPPRRVARTAITVVVDGSPGNSDNSTRD